jgi:hypothetical protein
VVPRTSVKTTTVAVRVALLGAIALGLTELTEWPQWPARQALREAIRPVRLTNCTFKRFGHPNDGGYVMCANLLDKAAVAYSYGIEGRDDWGCDVSTQYHVAVHEYDCFNTTKPACAAGQLIFHPECIGPSAAVIEGRAYDSFTSQLDRNGDHGKHVVAKVDVEGAEWDSLLATSDDVLDRIEQLSMELHGTNEPRFLRLIEKLKKTFYVVNVHVNNFSCKLMPWPFPGSAYEILFVNRRLGLADVDSKAPPAADPLDSVNLPGRRDCQFSWN